MESGNVQSQHLNSLEQLVTKEQQEYAMVCQQNFQRLVAFFDNVLPVVSKVAQIAQHSTLENIKEDEEFTPQPSLEAKSKFSGPTKCQSGRPTNNPTPKSWKLQPNVIGFTCKPNATQRNVWSAISPKRRLSYSSCNVDVHLQMINSLNKLFEHFKISLNLIHAAPIRLCRSAVGT